MKNQAFKVVCVGTGYFSRFHLDAWQRIEAAEIVGIVSLNLKEAASTGYPAFASLEESAGTITADILDIITPPETHIKLIRTAISHNIRTIICQKPFCSSLEEAKEAASLARQAGVNLIVHENFRFQPWYRCMRKALDEGRIGKVHQATFRMRTGDGQGKDAYLDRQPYFQKMPRFLIHETGVHWFDTFRYLLGEPTAIYADLRKMNPAIAGEDAGHVLIDFADGVRAIFDGNRHLDHVAENKRLTFGEALIEGDKGTLELSGDGAVTFRAFGELEKATLLEPQEWSGFAGDCVHALNSHVTNGLANGAPFENTAAEYVRVLEMEEAAYRSMAERRKIEF